MKKIASYLCILTISLILGINVVKAADYNFDIKVYKTDNVNTFLNDYKTGKAKEVIKGTTLNVGDTIAVSMYINSNNPTASIFEIRLNWDKYLLEPVLNSDGNTYGEADLRSEAEGGIYNANTSNPWTNSFAGSIGYYKGTTPRVNGFIYNSLENLKISKSGSIGFLYFKIKEDVVDNTTLTFSYNRADAFTNYGRDEISTDVVSTYFKIRGNLAAPYTLKGDLNGNGKIDYGDVRMMISYVGRTTSLNANEMSVADINGDGKINLLDQVAIINLYDSSN